MVLFEWFGHNFILHPARCMFWEKENTLILSDLHLGKTGHFRKEGIAVPQQVYQNDLNRLISVISYFNPEEIILVGDLFHSKANKEWEWFTSIRNNFLFIKFRLVLGNHDRLPHGMEDKMGIEVKTSIQKKNILFLHNAEDKANLDTVNIGMICGHIHPAIQFQSGIRQKMRLPCFHFTPTICTLPAFSLFTGSHTIKPKVADRVFAITENEIIAL
jgi:DNA ligase-associated metallophosphoesterase